MKFAEVMHQTPEVASRIDHLLDAVPTVSAAWVRFLLTATESYRVFAALDNELFICDSPIDGPLLITSATSGEGRTSLALLLAVLSAVADTKRRVLLVDGDSTGNGVGKLLGQTGRGLAEFLAEKATMDECVRATPLPNLQVVPWCEATGPMPHFTARGFARFVDSVRTGHDLIVFDAPAAGQNKQVLSMARCIGSVLLVIRYSGPTREQVAEVALELRRAKANILGCILNRREFVIPDMLYGHR
ncbi:MAG: hypothetical protein IOMNBAOH_01717 [Rhodocyclaceae bacterium]|nr:hypothetical protein [Rhodocyclaceae bacterium]